MARLEIGLVLVLLVFVAGVWTGCRFRGAEVDRLKESNAVATSALKRASGNYASARCVIEKLETKVAIWKQAAEAYQEQSNAEHEMAQRAADELRRLTSAAVSQPLPGDCDGAMREGVARIQGLLK